MSLPSNSEPVTRYGPLEPYGGERGVTGEYKVPPPSMICPDCPRLLRLDRAQPVAGAQCGVDFVLLCSGGHAFRWFSGDDFTPALHAERDQ